MNKPYLSVIIPCYNESENIRRGVIDQVYNFLATQKFDWEILISDDGSTDDSRQVIEQVLKDKKNCRLLNNKHGGKPYAVWCGIQSARGDYVLFDDMDQSTPITQLAKLLPFLGNFDVIIGSRGVTRKNFSLVRKVGSAVFLTVRKLLLLRQIDDTQCGFKAMRRSVALEIFPLLEFFTERKAVTGWKVTSYDVELLFLADKHGYLIKEVPVEWADADISTGKKRSYLKESQDMLKQILRIKINDVRGLYQYKHL